MALHAKRTTPSLSQVEAELLLKINACLPEDVQWRYDQLTAKRDDETLSNAEYEELLRLTTQVEAFDVARLEALSKLAAHRGVTLPALMHQLDIESSADE